MDVDTEGKMYFAWTASNGEYINFDIISPDDSEKTLNGQALTEEMGKYYGFSDGIAYYAKVSPDAGNKTLADLGTYVLSAYDLRDEKLLWTAKIKFDPHVTTLNTSGIGLIMYNWDIFQAYVANNVTPVRDIEGREPDSPGLTSRSMIQVTIRANAVYVVNWAYNYVNPFIFDNSTCVYAGGICALDSNGKILWSRETDSYVTAMTEKNGTIFYSTGDGRLSSTGVDMAAGFALAAAYLFFRFFMLGAVSRARTRLDQNQNRARLLDFIAGNPGATLYEMARVLGMNVGTVRYHLLILSVNHKVRTSKDRKKYVRYFTNRGAYTEDEMVVLTLLKREHVGRLIDIMISCPGTSNRELSLATGLPDSVVSRYMRELAGQGIIEKRRQENGRLSYVLVERYKNAVSSVRSQDNAEWHASPDKIGVQAMQAIAMDE
jgi:predicted transcriptional regulator